MFSSGTDKVGGNNPGTNSEDLLYQQHFLETSVLPELVSQCKF